MKNLNNIEVNAVNGAADCMCSAPYCYIYCTAPGDDRLGRLELEDCYVATAQKAKKEFEQKGGTCGKVVSVDNWVPCDGPC